MSFEAEGRQEAAVLDAADRLQGWLAGTFAYTAYRGRAPDGVPQLRSDIRIVLDARTLIPAKPAVESICSNCSGKGTEPGYVNDDGPPVDIKCEICGGAKPAVEVVEALKALEPFAKIDREMIQGHLSGHIDDEDKVYVRAGDIRAAAVCNAALQAPATPDAQTEVEK